MSREEMRKLMEAVSGKPDQQAMLQKYGVEFGEYVTKEEKEWVVIVLDREIDWGSIQDVDAVLSEADPQQKMYQDFTAMGDDVPNAMSFNIRYFDRIDQILRQSDTGYDLETILTEWPGPGTYSGDEDDFGDEL